MIQSMMLRQRKGRYDPKDLEGVLPVLDRSLYDGGDGGVVPCLTMPFLSLSSSVSEPSVFV